MAIQRTDQGRIAALEFRLEPVDERWPADKRLAELYADYARARDKNR